MKEKLQIKRSDGLGVGGMGFQRLLRTFLVQLATFEYRLYIR